MLRQSGWWLGGLALTATACAPVVLSHMQRDSSSEASEAAPNDRGRQLFTRANIDALDTVGFFVVDNVLSPDELRLIDKDLRSLEFEENGNQDSAIRTDHVVWLSSENSSNGAALNRALDFIRGFPKKLENIGFDGPLLGVPRRNQLAMYAGGGEAYSRHLDSPIRGNWFENISAKLSNPDIFAREVSFVLYLNPSIWDASQGGLLRCYSPENTGEIKNDANSISKFSDISPHGGRLVVFLSRKTEHEVLPTRQRRVALTLWAGGESTWPILRPFRRYIS